VDDEVEVDDNELDHEGSCDEEDDNVSKGQATGTLDHVILLNYTRSVCVSCFI